MLDALASGTCVTSNSASVDVLGPKWTSAAGDCSSVIDESPMLAPPVATEVMLLLCDSRLDKLRVISISCLSPPSATWAIQGRSGC